MENRILRPCRPELDRKLALSIEALRFSLRASLFEFRKLKSISLALEASPDPVPWEDAFELIVRSWSLVDALSRSNDVFLHTPGLSRKLDWVKSFESALAPIRKVRNSLQHLHERIGRMPESSPPTGGALSWICSDDPSQVVTVTLSASATQFSFYTLPFDRLEGKFVSNYSFFHDESQVAFSDVIWAVERFSENFESYLDGSGLLGEGETKGIRLVVRMVPGNLPGLKP